MVHGKRQLFWIAQIILLIICGIVLFKNPGQAADQGTSPKESSATTVATSQEDPWWEVKDDVLTLYPHQINLPVIQGRGDWPWESQRATIKEVVIKPGVQVLGSAFGMFEGLTQVQKFTGLTNLDTSQVTDMHTMFADCPQLMELDVSRLTTDQVQSFSGMFRQDQSLTKLDLTNFQTGKATSLRSMFSGCRQLQQLVGQHFDTRQVTDMGYLFANCEKLTSIALSHWQTPAVVNFGDMFSNCQAVQKLDVQHFDLQQATSVLEMFAGCQNLLQLDLWSWQMPRVQKTTRMLEKTPKLWKLSLGPQTNIGQANLPAAPGQGTPFPEDNDYLSQTTNWQALGAGSDYHPQGAKLSAAQIMQNYQGQTPPPNTETYVWEPAAAETFYLQTVPLNLTFGHFIVGQKCLLLTPDDQKIIVIDQRAQRAGKKWRVEVVATPFQTDKQQLVGQALQYQGQSLAQAVTIFQATSRADKESYSWQKAPSQGIVFNSAAIKNASPGEYHSTVTYTLMNSLN
ncbi:BspA family leucine-rich repeat surface protein [Lactobacillus sp. DCY120]|uniref:BspA family leucine-rich repeat surface protein n=1 Tax=Bombilactobacillus apium TaxID=2675299 RepID=A0A850R6M3_9LACO|nr:BspA family leucine-rich repeat surface protein [Bombilactobacillus apium]NVY96292.1 BspA family leucine-rich repeat surface protein [Bombilactobacillus apium]